MDSVGKISGRRNSQQSASFKSLNYLINLKAEDPKHGRQMGSIAGHLRDKNLQWKSGGVSRPFTPTDSA